MLLLIGVLFNRVAAGQVTPFDNPETFSEDAVLLHFSGFPSFHPGKYLLQNWGVTFGGQGGVMTFLVSEEPQTCVGPPRPPLLILSNGIPENGRTELPLVIESDYALKRIGFFLATHDAQGGSQGDCGASDSVAVQAVHTITAFNHAGQLLGSVVQEGKWFFLGLEATGEEGISRVTIKSDQGIKGIRGLMLEHVSRPQFTTYLPQLADGAGVRSAITLLNLSETAARGTTRLYDSAGNGLELGGMDEASDFVLAPHSSRVITTNGDGELKTGYGVVTSNCPLQVQAVFTSVGDDGTVREAGSWV